MSDWLYFCEINMATEEKTRMRFRTHPELKRCDAYLYWQRGTGRIQCSRRASVVIIGAVDDVFVCKPHSNDKSMCTCGHLKREHRSENYIDWECVAKHCPCGTFRPLNLRAHQMKGNNMESNQEKDQNRYGIKDGR